MKTIFFFLLLCAISANARPGFGSGLNDELIYVYGVFILLLLIIIATDQFLKYVFKRLRDRQNNLDDQSSL